MPLRKFGFGNPVASLAPATVATGPVMAKVYTLAILNW